MVLSITLAIISFLASLHFINSKYWIFVIPIYFSRQLSAILAILVGLKILIDPQLSVVDITILSIAATLAIYHLYRFFPYTRFANKEVMDTTGSESQNITLIVSNVLQSNDSYSKLTKVIAKYTPDLLIGLETDKEWIEHIKNNNTDILPYSIEVPRDDTYGMCIFSKYPLNKVQIKEVTDVPSIACDIKMNGETDNIRLYVLHPRPPIPPESRYSFNKNKEQAVLSHAIKAEGRDKVIVAGDINDVAWSRHTQEFLKRSQLKDPRKGRKSLNSFPTQMPMLGFPLDQVYCSDQFKIASFKRLEGIDSDHYPIYVQLGYE